MVTQNRILAAIAQLVEQGTENPCVLGSIPSCGTIKKRHPNWCLFYFKILLEYYEKLILPEKSNLYIITQKHYMIRLFHLDLFLCILM